MKSVNLHCDTLLRAAQQQGPEADLLHCPGFQVDLARMRQGGMDVNFFAIFLPPETHLKAMGLDTYAACIDLLAGIFDRNMERHKDLIAPARCTRDIEHNRSRSLMSGVLTMEDGIAVYDRRENLEHFYAMGVRALSLTWNFENCFGFPNSPDPAQMALGLKPFGR
ncbi:MAG: dipeptidase, partial [Clostridiales bacterium]|nr:dipeptidase [Clostridiales bacterium]